MVKKQEYSKLIGMDKKYLEEVYGVTDQDSYDKYLKKKREEAKEVIEEQKQKEEQIKAELNFIQHPPKSD